MSSFFTLPASQKKRKRAEPPKTNGTAQRKAPRDDDSISGSDLSDDDAPTRPTTYSASESDESDFEDEDPAAKRVRLAEQYLANTQKEVLDDVGFDAAQVDQENLRSRMGERLKEDTAESKGKLYRLIADDLDWRRASKRALRCPNVNKSWTGVDIHGQYIYAADSDLSIVKWELPDPDQAAQKGQRTRTTPKVVAHTRGNRKHKRSQHHENRILCLAVSPDGKFVATGGADRKLIIWDSTNLTPLKVFTQHRDAVTALAFRRGTNQLFSASTDRTVKIWSLDELAYIETLFGHQDSVVDVAALGQEKCVTVGARDRTARLWKVVEESQLVFRGGGAPGTHKALASLRAAYKEDSGVGNGLTENDDDQTQYHEGSMDRLALIDDETFLTAADNGSLSLWNINKKKAVFTLPLAHGLDPALPLEEATADISPEGRVLEEKSRGGKQPRWITAMKAVPFSDLVVTGSWDGFVRVWKVSSDKRRIEALGAVGKFEGGEGSVDALLEAEGVRKESLSSAALGALRAGVEGEADTSADVTMTSASGSRAEVPETPGIINDLAIVDRGARGQAGVLIAAAVGKEHRLGRWKKVPQGQNRVVLFEVRRKSEGGDDMEGSPEDSADAEGGEGDFAGFD